VSGVGGLLVAFQQPVDPAAHPQHLDDHRLRRDVHVVVGDSHDVGVELFQGCFADVCGLGPASVFAGFVGCGHDQCPL
jgi:hypothetical protein